MKNFYISLLVIASACLIFAGEAVPLPEISRPQRIYIDGAQMFITEGATIYIYSLKDFKLQKKFGKKGEGPGEFKESGEGVFLIFNPESLMVVSRGRLSSFTRDGRFVREETISNPRNFEFQRLGDQYVGTTLQVEKDGVFFTINLFDKNFKKLKELYRYKHPFFPRHKPINPVDLRTCTHYVYQNRIFYDDENGTIHVLDHIGNKLYAITHKYERIKITEAQKKRYLSFWQTDLRAEYDSFKDRFRFPASFPCIRDYHILNDRIYIILFKEIGIRSQILIFDLQGKLLIKTQVPLADINMLIPLGFNYYTIHGDKIYILRENEKLEEWELHIEDI